MKLLIIDNYDSFTFNLYQLAAEVFDDLPVVAPNDSSFAEIADQDFDAVIISPGPGTPTKDSDFGISKDAILQMNVPILGVCLGHQGMAHLLGGSILHAPTPMHGREDKMYHNGDGLFQNVPCPFTAVRYHSLIVAEPLPSCLEKTAWTADGLVMGLAHKSRPMWGVQFHPESICSAFGRMIMENFHRMAKAFHSASSNGSFVAASATERKKLPIRRPAEINEGSPLQMFVRQMPAEHSAEQIFERAFLKERYAFWLDSSLTREPDARFSFLGGDSDERAECIRYYVHNGRLTIERDGIQELTSEELFPYIKERLAGRRITGPELPFDFDGGFVGYFGYELKAICGARSARKTSHPDCYAMLTTRFVALDHLSGEMYLVFIGEPGAECEASAWFDRIEGDIANSPAPRGPENNDDGDLIRFEPVHSEGAYLEKIKSSLDAISDGETYEVCLTNQLTAATRIEPFEYYKKLRKRNPAPYSAFLKFPELSVACSSPERFLKVDRDAAVETKPIKGTSRRGSNRAEDEFLKRSLEEDEKSRSENLMIVDLLRNDLGRVCKTGSVHVPKLMHVESYQTVHQLVSTVSGTLDQNLTSVDCLRAALPGGSMTGAPKIRTMEIIDELEGVPRGVYSGSIGFLSFNGRADLNIVIRTAVFSRKTVSIGVGGAIIALSDPSEEWAETLLKAKALLATFQDFYKNVLLMNRPVEMYGKTSDLSKRAG